MLRWLIAILVLANVLAFVATRGVFGPLPSSGPREPERLNRQIHPEWLKVTPLSAAEAMNASVVVGGPAPIAPIAASELAQ
jgi:hypothetical protein